MALVAALMLSPAAGARQISNPDTPFSCDGMKMQHHIHRARVLIAEGYDLDRWRDASPARDSEKGKWQEHRRCVLHQPERKAISDYRDRMKRKFERHRDEQLQLDALTPYGPWAIPSYIVMCESGGSWSAANPSGAVGPYQLLGKGAPWPVDSESDRIAHHRIAGNLWAGGAGASHWVCA